MLYYYTQFDKVYNLASIRSYTNLWKGRSSICGAIRDNQLAFYFCYYICICMVYFHFIIRKLKQEFVDSSFYLSWFIQNQLIISLSCFLTWIVCIFTFYCSEFYIVMKNQHISPKTGLQRSNLCTRGQLLLTKTV